jgi:hypothetical protein
MTKSEKAETQASEQELAKQFTTLGSRCTAIAV